MLTIDFSFFCLHMTWNSWNLWMAALRKLFFSSVSTDVESEVNKRYKKTSSWNTVLLHFKNFCCKGRKELLFKSLHCLFVMSIASNWYCFCSLVFCSKLCFLKDALAYLSLCFHWLLLFPVFQMHWHCIFELWLSLVSHTKRISQNWHGYLLKKCLLNHLARITQFSI